MGKESGSAPETPDPAKLIPMQTAADKNTFNYQTDANRYNTFGPDQNVTWEKQSVVDQAGYDNALKSWQQANSTGTWVPTVAGSYSGGGGGEGGSSGTYDPGTPGHWEGATSNGTAAPTLGDYTTNKYSQRTTLSPAAQAAHDQMQASQVALSKQAQDQYKTAWDGGAGAPDLVRGIDPGNARTNAGLSTYEGRLAN